jgi:hypothetical protein
MLLIFLITVINWFEKWLYTEIVTQIFESEFWDKIIDLKIEEQAWNV